MTDELWRWSAVDLAQAIAQGAVSSEDATRSVLGRIEAVNPQVNAIVDLMADEALQAARQADTARRSGAACASSLGRAAAAAARAHHGACVDRARLPHLAHVTGKSPRIPAVLSESGPCSCSPDGAKRNPGLPYPHCAALHAGYKGLDNNPI